MLHRLADNVWHITHEFKSMGLSVVSRMTVVRCAGGALWLHSPVPITPALQQALDALGTVRWIVAPNCAHHLFAGPAQAVYPQALLYGAPGLRAKRPDLTTLQDLPNADATPWLADLDQVFVAGMPLVNETVWLHRASGTVIVTDLCMWFRQPSSWSMRLYGRLNGTLKGLAVSRLVRLLTRDRAAAAASCQHIVQWPIQRVVVAHDCVLEDDAKGQLERALAWFAGR